jgi:hypothetical protein
VSVAPIAAPIAFRLTIGDTEEWFDTASAVDAAVANTLGLSMEQLEPARRRITVDPVVVRRDGARWRSRHVWSFRSASASARVYEMLRIDEAAYDH